MNLNKNNISNNDDLIKNKDNNEINNNNNNDKNNVDNDIDNNFEESNEEMESEEFFEDFEVENENLDLDKHQIMIDRKLRFLKE